MCGIAGVIKTKGIVDTNAVIPMLACLTHRGPDDEGVWVSAVGKAAFGQRRLAIIDLSVGGHQPQVSPDTRYAITFNGEIYNYEVLRIELMELGWKFTSKSDTEVLLNSFIEWGEQCLQKLNGMFAFAIWDEQTQTLFAARDRLGEKPFKYYTTNDTFVFASEVKAILAYPGVPRTIDWQAIDVALSFRFVPAPATGFTSVQKLPAGHYLRWQAGKVVVTPYWFPTEISVDQSTSFKTNKKELWELFVDSVSKRLVSDVPIGAFLSGGVDSTSVVAAVRAVRNEPIDTFVISLGGRSPDQEYAAIAAKYFGTRHHELALENIDYQAALERLAYHFDEPFFDASALPSLLITEAMKSHATVVLSGDGGDELFGGYPAYQAVERLRRYGGVPRGARDAVTKLAGIKQGWQYRAEIAGLGWPANYTEYYSLWKTALPQSHLYLSKQELYRTNLQGLLKNPASVALMNKWLNGVQTQPTAQAMLADILGRLADGYLTKVDLAAMANGVEVRPPFLDHRLVERALRVPVTDKLPGGGKYIWKEIARQHLPQAILDRPKVGFSFPLDELLRTNFSGSIRGILFDPQAQIYEHFNVAAVRQMWEAHLARQADYSNHLWSLLMLELWLRHYQK